MITFLDTYQTDFASRDIEAKASPRIANLDFVMVVYADPDDPDAFVVVLVLDASLPAVVLLPAEHQFVVDHTCSYCDDFDAPFWGNNKWHEIENVFIGNTHTHEN